MVASVVVAVLAGACGSAQSALEHGPSDEVKAATVGSLGRILVDGEGLTLYVFAADKHSGTSTCTGTCANEWPPVTLPPRSAAPVAGAGIDPALLGVTSRGSGVEQVTYAGWPLYQWPNDFAPGMATGEGVDDSNGLWYVLRPSGQVVR